MNCYLIKSFYKFLKKSVKKNSDRITKRFLRKFIEKFLKQSMQDFPKQYVLGNFEETVNEFIH